MNCNNCGSFIRNPLNFCPYCREPLNPVLPPLLINSRQKRKSGKTVIFALALLIIALALYFYKGQEAITFIETRVSRGQKTAPPDKPAATDTQTGQKDMLMPKPPAKYTEQATGMEFVFIPGGCYRMGDIFGDGDADEKPAHEVCVSDYYLSKFEVTQGQWEALMGKNPSLRSGKNSPVEKISLQDTQNFIASLKSKNSGYRFRLPTEAEWEFACRSGGKEEKWAGTTDEAALAEYAWFGSNSGGNPHAVGKAKPNGLGLYDMSGNVYEWVEDYYSPDCYQDQARDNPICIKGSYRVIRGGSAHLSERFARCSARSSASSSVNTYSVGFRLVREK